MSDIKIIESLFNKYANRQASSVQISKVFINFIAFRLVENYISGNMLGFKDRKKILARKVGNL